MPRFAGLGTGAQRLGQKIQDTSDGRIQDQYFTAAADGLLDEMRALDAAMAGTIGLRIQAKVPREVALYLARRTAGHRDISPYF